MFVQYTWITWDSCMFKYTWIQIVILFNLLKINYQFLIILVLNAFSIWLNFSYNLSWLPD